MQQEHAIPQQISAYQFRLVGDMTLNQFFQVAGGALVALLIYSSSLPPYFKAPLMVFSFFLGVAFAFFPLQDRPLATWLILFFKAIYSPTIYLWKRGAEKRDFFVPEDAEITLPVPAPSTQPPLENVTLQQPTEPQPTETFEIAEMEFLSNVQRQIELPGMILTQNVQVQPSPPKTQASTLQDKKREVRVIEMSPIKIDRPHTETVQNKGEVPAPSNFDESFVPQQKQQISGASSANFVPEASPPIPPTSPNIIVGQVLDSNGKIIENAILEILDQQGMPIRALKSNKLGHFMIVTPLSNGAYTIKTEKEGYQFDAISFEAKGDIISPIAIIAKPFQQ